jgi:hypothetical protein
MKQILVNEVDSNDVRLKTMRRTDRRKLARTEAKNKEIEYATRTRYSASNQGTVQYFLDCQFYLGDIML